MTAAVPEDRVLFLDVGHGNASIVHSTGSATLVVDCPGPGAEKVLSVLRNLGATSVDAVVVSHGDLDHCAGVPVLLRSLAVQSLYMNLGWAVERTGQRDSRVRAVLLSIFDAVEDGRVSMEGLVAPKSIDVKDVSLDVLSPPYTVVARASVTDATNRSSIVINMHVSGRSVLFPGDVDDNQLGRMLTEGSLGPVDILVVPHHGGHLRLTSDLLAAVKPRVAVISNGRGRAANPAKSTLSALRATGCRIMCTQVSRHCEPSDHLTESSCAGTVSVELDGDVTVTPTEEAHARRIASLSSPQCQAELSAAERRT